MILQAVYTKGQDFNKTQRYNLIHYHLASLGHHRSSLGPGAFNLPGNIKQSTFVANEIGKEDMS